METKSNTTTPATPAKPLSPGELAQELLDLVDQMRDWKLEEERRKADEAVQRVRAKIERAGARKLRVLRAKSIEEAKAILAENDADLNLKKLCQRLTGWKPLQEKGGTDEQILATIGRTQGGWPWSRQHPHAVPSAEHGYGSPRVWVDPDKGPEGKEHLNGQKLVDAVRRVMNVPKPAAPKPTTTPAKKPAPATKPAAKKAAPAKKAPAAPKADEPAAAGKKSGQCPDPMGHIDRFFANGRAAQAAVDELVSVKALEQPQAPIDPPPAPKEIILQPQGYYDADKFGLTPAVLAEAMTHVSIRPAPGVPSPRPAKIGKPVKIVDRFWAVVGAANETGRITYQLVPIRPEGEPGGIVLYDDFGDLVDDNRDAKKAPEDYELDGLRVVDPAGMPWVVGANEIYLRVPRDPAKEAQAAHDATLAAGGTFGQAVAAGTAKLQAAAAEDSHCNGRGEFVDGVEQLTVQPLGTTGDRPLIVIRVARGDDGRYRTGHALAFADELWGADSDEPVKLDSAAVEDRGYAIKTRALILITRMQAAYAATADKTQRRAFTATIRKLQSYIDTSPNVNSTRRPAMAG